MPSTNPQPAPILPDDASAAEAVAAFLTASHGIDVATWLERLSRSDAAHHLLGLDPERRADVFASLSLSAQADLARLMSATDLAEIVRRMEADDRADLFNLLTPEEQQHLLGRLAQKVRDDILRLAAYAEDTAGAIMTSAYAILDAEMTAQGALAELKRQAPDTETIYRSYVLDEHRHLIGSVQLHKLVVAADTALIRDIMETNPVSAASDTDREDVAKLIARYDLVALPVVDSDGILLGIVTHDDAADAMRAEMTEDFQKIATVLPFTQSMRDASIRMLYSRRIVWLALLVFGNLFSGAGIAYFEDTILAYVALVFFLPLLIDSSGNAGSQSATLMVRALATGDVAMTDWRDLILRELFIAAALGGTMALVVAPLGLWRGGSDIAMVVGLTMFFVVIIGSLVGMSLPFLLSRLKLDPATASGPLVTTISDAVGVFIYFSIATLMLGP